jgi:hypothetical protein
LSSCHRRGPRCKVHEHIGPQTNNLIELIDNPHIKGRDARSAPGVLAEAMAMAQRRHKEQI